MCIIISQLYFVKTQKTRNVCNTKITILFFMSLDGIEVQIFKFLTLVLDLCGIECSISHSSLVIHVFHLYIYHQSFSCDSHGHSVYYYFGCFMYANVHFMLFYFVAANLLVFVYSFNSLYFFFTHKNCFCPSVQTCNVFLQFPFKIISIFYQ